MNKAMVLDGMPVRRRKNGVDRSELGRERNGMGLPGLEAVFESIEHVKQPNTDTGKRARRRQMQAEAAVRRRREAEQESERLARSLSQP